MRSLKHHEQKLLRKVKLYEPWKNEGSIREAQVMRRYNLRDREDYSRYNKLCGIVTKLASLVKTLPQDDKFRIKVTEQLCDRMYNLGLVNRRNSLEACAKVNVSAFCRRRLPVVLTSNKWTENVKEATQFVEQGHFQVGNEVVKDPNTLVSRTMEDHVSWADSSRIKRKIQAYKNVLDDYDLMA